MSAEDDEKLRREAEEYNKKLRASMEAALKEANRIAEEARRRAAEGK